MTDRPVALITGATSGIGRAVAEELGRDHHVLVGGRTLERVAPVVAGLASAEAFVADLALGELPPLPSRVDVLVHSAGVQDGGRVEDTAVEVWRSVFEVNVFAVAELTRKALPALRRATGQVVFINSGSGLHSGPGWSVYSASKFALRALADALREEERPHGIRVASVHPGRTDTPMQERLVQHEGGAYTPQYFLSPTAVADVVRGIIDAPANATVESVSIRPSRTRPSV